jgi:DNA polymerase epsilon subunit 1
MSTIFAGDAVCESILFALYRYLCGYGDALLHDPLLHRIVYLLMSKLFKKLIAQLRKLGVRIIHASFSRILVHTNKYDMDSAKEYIDFIISTISSNELFSLMEVRLNTHWNRIAVANILLCLVD